MAIWTSEQELFALMKEKLYTPVVGDIWTKLGTFISFYPKKSAQSRKG